MDFKNLQRPFPPNEWEWRVQSSGKGARGVWAKIVPYVDNRAIQERLDEIGPENWSNQYQAGPQGGVLCGVSIRGKDEFEWITKWDGAENTDIESVKGGLSDSMKRCAVQWGIGRHLYDMGVEFADIVDKNTGNYAKAKDGTVFYWLPPAKYRQPASVDAGTGEMSDESPVEEPSGDQFIEEVPLEIGDGKKNKSPFLSTSELFAGTTADVSDELSPTEGLDEALEDLRQITPLVSPEDAGEFIKEVKDAKRNGDARRLRGIASKWRLRLGSKS